MLHLELADKSGLKWAQEKVTEAHYLHKPVDVRCSPVAYIVTLTRPGRALLPEKFREDLTEEQRLIAFPGKDVRRVGCLIFGRPESTRVNGWYGSVQDIASGQCRLSRWCVLNLARVWLHPDIQQGGTRYIENAATWVIAQALRRVGYDYLISKPPVWMNEPYEIQEVLSYCDTRIHTGTLYKASNFQRVRTNEKGIETYARPIRHLTHAEKKEIAGQSARDKRCQKLRAQRMQGMLFEEVS